MTDNSTTALRRPRTAVERRRAVSFAAAKLRPVIAVLDALTVDANHPERCGRFPEHAEAVIGVIGSLDAALERLTDTLAGDEEEPGTITFTVDVDTLNESLARAGKTFTVTPEHVRAAGMQVAEPTGGASA